MPQSALRIGTRGSRLARVQAAMAERALNAAGIPCETVPIKTTGDRILDRTLADAGGKGLFTKELEEALLAGTIDIAVHSMKDVPVELPQGLAIGAILPREEPQDVLLSPAALNVSQLLPGARVGTSSVRRCAQVKRARPDLDCVLLRGNVDTRLARLDSGQMDAIILALAGLKRLGLAERPMHILPTDEWLPSLAQGAVGIEIRHDDGRAAAAVKALDHEPSAVRLACERAFQHALDGSCRTPIAGLAEIRDGQLFFRGEVLAPDGSNFAEIAIGPIAYGNVYAVRAGREAGEALRPQAAKWLTL
jgi:hydroxymethylbilane synthase